MGKTTVADVERRRRALARSPLLGGIRGLMLDELVRKGTLLAFPRRAIVYKAGQDADAIFVVASGRARLFRGGSDDRDVTVDYRATGDLMGETILASAGVYAESAEAVEGLEVLRMGVAALLRAMEGEPGATGRVLRHILDKRIEA